MIIDYLKLVRDDRAQRTNGNEEGQAEIKRRKEHEKWKASSKEAGTIAEKGEVGINYIVIWHIYKSCRNITYA